MIIHRKDGRWQTNILGRLRYYFGNRDNPKPMWIAPLDSWITDPDEIIKAIRQDDVMGVRDAKKP